MMKQLYPGQRNIRQFGCVLVLLLGLVACKSDTDKTPAPLFDYALDTILEVAGRQGVATDGRNYAVSGSKALYRYSLDGKLLAKNLKPFAGLPGPVNHIGDIDIHDGELYAGVENFTDGHGEHIQIVVYDLETLVFKRAIPWEPASGQQEVCGIAVDVSRGLIWLADWLNGHYLYRYDLKTGAYAGRLELIPAPVKVQGIAVAGSRILLTADNGDADLGQHDQLYSIVMADDNYLAAGQLIREKTLSEFKRTGEVEGLCLSPRGNQLTVLMNRGTRIVQGMPQGYYSGYDREIHELYRYKIQHPLE